MMEENPMHKYEQLSNASGDSGFSGYSDSSNKSIEQPPSFTENNQNDTRATERAEVLKKHEFTITEELGHGISGRVFLVKSPDEDSFVVKEINYRDNVNFNLDAVKNEINILKKLHHGYIVGYKDSFEESGYFYIVSEYCAGGDLHKKMKTQEGTFEEEQILDWFVQICLALQYLHENNILHRDIKPQNVFLTEDGYINLGDVGCSKVLKRADEYATTIVGTELYVSPEIYKNRHNSKSDIWSLGWLLHDLCMLDMWSNMIERRCLHANSLKGTIPKISNRYSEDLKELICQMLSCDPHMRPSADEILAKPFLEVAVKRHRRIPDALQQRFLTSINPYRNLNLELKRNIEELQLEFVRNRQTLTDKIKELDDATDELESMHRNTTVGSLVGASVGAAGGVAAIAGVCLAPFTLGASLALTGAAVVAGVAGGVTSGASNITNMVRQKTLRQNIEKIINDFQTTIKPMVKLLDKIYDITENIALEKKTLNKLDIQRAGRGAVDVLKMAGVANVADIGISCAEAAKEIRVYVKAVKAARGSASAARAVRATAETTKSIRATAALTGALSAVFLALDIYSIVKDLTELSEMNQPADKRKEEEISSETLLFIFQIKAVTDQFKKIVEKIKDAIDTFI